MYDTILVATDGSDAANVQSNTLPRLQTGTRVHALYCVEIHRYGKPALSSTAIAHNQLEEQGQATLETVRSVASPSASSDRRIDRC